MSIFTHLETKKEIEAWRVDLSDKKEPFNHTKPIWKGHAYEYRDPRGVKCLHYSTGAFGEQTVYDGDYLGFECGRMFHVPKDIFEKAFEPKGVKNEF